MQSKQEKYVTYRPASSFFLEQNVLISSERSEDEEEEELLDPPLCFFSRASVTSKMDRARNKQALSVTVQPFSTLNVFYLHFPRLELLSLS